jgi:repressor LexA
VQNLTERQQEVLEIIRRHMSRNGEAPTVREIAKALGVSSTCTVQKHIEALEKKGCLSKSKYGYRSIEIPGEISPSQIKSIPVPVVGRIAAGQPLLASDNVETYLPIPADMAHAGDLFALKVRGDSMKDAGIFHGDIIVARRQETAINGDIVVALLDDEATVKTFYNDGGAVRLQPENPDYEPIITREVQVLGKVTLSIRQF